MLNFWSKVMRNTPDYGEATMDDLIGKLFIMCHRIFAQTFFLHQPTIRFVKSETCSISKFFQLT